MVSHPKGYAIQMEPVYYPASGKMRLHRCRKGRGL